MKNQCSKRQDLFDFENIVLKGHNGCEQFIQEQIENISDYYDILTGENSITQQGNDSSSQSEQWDNFICDLFDNILAAENTMTDDHNDFCNHSDISLP